MSVRTDAIKSLFSIWPPITTPNDVVLSIIRGDPTPKMSDAAAIGEKSPTMKHWSAFRKDPVKACAVIADPAIKAVYESLVPSPVPAAAPVVARPVPVRAAPAAAPVPAVVAVPAPAPVVATLPPAAPVIPAAAPAPAVATVTPTLTPAPVAAGAPMPTPAEIVARATAEVEAERIKAVARRADEIEAHRHAAALAAIAKATSDQAAADKAAADAKAKAEADAAAAAKAAMPEEILRVADLRRKTAQHDQAAELDAIEHDRRIHPPKAEPAHSPGGLGHDAAHRREARNSASAAELKARRGSVVIVAPAHTPAALVPPPAAPAAAPVVAPTTPVPAPATPPTAPVVNNNGGDSWKWIAIGLGIVTLMTIVVTGMVLVWLAFRQPDAPIVASPTTPLVAPAPVPAVPVPDKHEIQMTLDTIQDVEGICAACKGKTLGAATCDQVADTCDSCEKHGTIPSTCDRIIRRGFRDELK